jgi:hypothetical protein
MTPTAPFEIHDRMSRVFHFDLSRESMTEPVHRLRLSHEPQEQIDPMNPLIHQSATTVDLPTSPPSGRSIVIMGAVIFHIGVGNQEFPPSPILQTLFDFLDIGTIPNLKDRPHLAFARIGGGGNRSMRSVVISSAFPPERAFPDRGQAGILGSRMKAVFPWDRRRTASTTAQAAISRMSLKVFPTSRPCAKSFARAKSTSQTAVNSAEGLSMIPFA